MSLDVELEKAHNPEAQGLSEPVAPDEDAIFLLRHGAMCASNSKLHNRLTHFHPLVNPDSPLDAMH